MKSKIIIYTLSLFILAVIQSTFLGYINIKPNLMLVFVVCMAILRGNTEGAAIGFFAGLLQDLLTGKALGFYSALGIVGGFFAGSVNRRLYRENIFVCIVSVFISTVIYEFVVFIPILTIEGASQLVYAFRSIIIPEAFLNSAAAVIIFLMAIKISRRIEIADKSDRNY